MADLNYQFVTDRTKNDVVFGITKGHYSAEDLNRVGTAVEAFAPYLIEMGHDVMDVNTKTNWSYSDFPTKTLISNYIRNIRLIKNAFNLSYKMPTLTTLYTVEMANNIEKVLEYAQNEINKKRVVKVYSGQINSGENIL